MLSMMAIFSTTIYANIENGAQTPSAWAVESVARARDMNLIPVQGGYQQATTRAEFSAFAVRLYQHQNGAITGYNRNQFTDTNDPYVARAAHVGLVNGVGDGRFNPNGLITRQEAATFGDTGSVPAWARDGINWAQSTTPTVMGGVGNNMFAPTGAYTREQTAVSLVRVYDVVNGNGVVAPPVTPTPGGLVASEWGEVVVLGMHYTSQGRRGQLSFAKKVDNDWFIFSSGHYARAHDGSPVDVLGGFLRIGQDVWDATALANTGFGVVSIAKPHFAEYLDALPRIRIANPAAIQTGPAFMHSGFLNPDYSQTFDVNITYVSPGRISADITDSHLINQGINITRQGMSGSAFTQYINGEKFALFSLHGGNTGYALHYAMPHFHSIIEDYRQGRIVMPHLRHPDFSEHEQVDYRGRPVPSTVNAPNLTPSGTAPSVGGAANQPAVNVPGQVSTNGGRRVVGRAMIKAKLRDTWHGA